MSKPKYIELFAKNKTERDWEKITDLYWFEEQGVHWFDGEGHFDKYEFMIIVDGKKMMLSDE